MSLSGITGIVLAGGKSRRMGNEKGLIELNSKPLIQYAIDALEPICETILISTNSHFYDFLPYQKITDEFPNSGPMGGIYSCLKASKTDQNLVLSCDMPFIKSQLLADLIENSDGFDIVVPWHGEQQFEPICAFYRKNVEPTFRIFILQKNYKIPDAFDRLKTKKFEINTNLHYYSTDLFFNVNSQEEFFVLQGKLKSDHD
ncbi:MAG: molybdenum cofactor guanylyltransferase [Bacteroidetes bacterium]|nr:molybdenum cofactor guanylyltransferase [Bacteroidota bacterium]